MAAEAEAAREARAKVQGVPIKMGKKRQLENRRVYQQKMVTYALLKTWSARY